MKVTVVSVNRIPLSLDSWIKFNRSSLAVYGLPLDVHAGLHEFLVTAENSRNKATAIPLEVFTFYDIHC